MKIFFNEIEEEIQTTLNSLNDMREKIYNLTNQFYDFRYKISKLEKTNLIIDNVVMREKIDRELGVMRDEEDIPF